MTKSLPVKILDILLNNEIKKYPKKLIWKNDDEFKSAISFDVLLNRLEKFGICDYSKQMNCLII